MKQFIFLLIFLFTSLVSAQETGPANSVIRVPSGGGKARAGSIDLSASAAVGSSVLPIANGGTNKALTLSAGGIPYFDANSFEVLAAGSAGQIPRSGGAGALTWSTAAYPDVATGTGKLLRADGTNWVASTATYPDTATGTGTILRADGTNWVATTATYPTTTTVGQLLHSSANNVVGGLPVGSAGDLLMSAGAGSAPSFTSTITGNKVFSGSIETETSLILEDPGAGTDAVTIQSGGGSYTLTLPPTDGGNNQALISDGDGNLDWADVATSAVWNHDGNTVGSEKWLGTADNFAIPFKTNNTTRFTIAAAGTTTFVKPVIVDGTADEIQLNVQANGTQTSVLANFETSAGTDLFTIAGTGSVTATKPVTIDGSADEAQFTVQANGTQTGPTSVVQNSDGNNVLEFWHNGNQFLSRGAAQPSVNLRRANTSLAAPSVVASGNVLGVLRGYGYSGAAAAYQVASSIQFAVGGTPDSGGDTTDMPGEIQFYTVPDGTTTETLRMWIGSAGQTVIGASAATAGAILDIQSTTQAVVLPKVATASLPTGVEGMFLYDTTLDGLAWHDGSSWRVIDDGGTGAGQTCTGVANVDSYTVFASGLRWSRVGNTVTVSFRIDTNNTAAGDTTTQLRCTLPIASAFANAQQASGNFYSWDETRDGLINADSTNDQFFLSWKSNTTGVSSIYGVFQYDIL